MFVDIENLTGGAGDDLFRFLNGGSISGTIDGAGGVNTLDYSAQVAGVAVDLNAGTATGLSDFSNVNKVQGGSGADTLRGLDASNVWTVSSLNAGTVGGTEFSDIENLEGGSVEDTFVVELGGGLTGTLSGGLGLDELIGADKLNTWTVDAGDSGTLNALPFEQIESLVGGSDEDEFLFALAGFVSGHFTGGPGLDRVRGANQQNTWRVKGNNSGDLNDSEFSGIENIEGGSDADDFIVEAGATLTQGLDGGAGNDNLFGPAPDTTWNVTGDDSGDVAGVAFSGIENLTGAADNEDTFFFEGNGNLSGVIEGGDGGFDSLELVGGVFSAVVYEAFDSHSGTITRDGQLITYAGLEPISDNMVVDDRVLGFSNVDQSIVITDNGDPADGQITVTSTAAESITFNNPANNLTINAGSGVDTITLQQLDNAFAANITINAGGSNDEIIIQTATATSPASLNINGEAGSDTIILEGGITLSGGSATPAVEGAGLNTVIDALLADNFDPLAPPDSSDIFKFTAMNLSVPNIITVGEADPGEPDLELENVTLTFSLLSYDSVSGWDGLVGVEAPVATLFPDGLGIEITDNDADLNAVIGTLDLSPGSGNVLLFDTLDAAGLGWPGWLDIKVTGLELEFADFRTDDTDSTLRLNGSFLGFKTGSEAADALIRSQLSVTGNVSGVEFDMDILGAAEGLVDLLKENPIVDISGISGEIKGSLFGVGSLSVGFILKQISLDADGAITTLDADTVKQVLYLAARGAIAFGGFPVEGESEPEGAFAFGLNFAISELGPLQFFFFVDAPIVLEPYSGLAISSLRAGIRFDTTIEGLQTRPPLAATEGSKAVSDITNNIYEITLTVPDHTLKEGDEFDIINAGNSNYDTPGDDNFQVTKVNGDDISYIVTGDPGAFDGADVKKISISDPFDLRDPGFVSSKDLSLADWEAQLDTAVANQGGASIWERLTNPKVVIEGGATMSFDPRIPDNIVGLDVDFLFDTELRLLLSGQMTLIGFVKLPVKLFIDLSLIDGGPARFLYLQEVPEIPLPGIDPLLVYRGSILFDVLINGVPASLDATTGLPPGVGINILTGSVEDRSSPSTGPGPWEVTFELDLPDGINASAEFDVGDSIVVVNSDPIPFNGTHIVTAVDDTEGTVSFRIGAAVIDSRIDLNFDNIVDALDVGLLGGIPVIAGALDINRDRKIDENDDGEVFSEIIDAFGNRQVIGYKVIDGLVDIDGDEIIDDENEILIADPDDDGVIGGDPGVWNAGSRVANLDDLGTGFRITLEGGIDLNIPFVTTLTLEGMASLDFTILGAGVPEDVRIDFSFDASLSETNFGNIGFANGAFHTTIDFDPVLNLQPPDVEVWGAAIVAINPSFLEPAGLFVTAEGLLRFNTSDDPKDEDLTDIFGDPLIIELPGNSFTLRLDGGIDFRIGTNEFFTIGGIFVLDFSPDGFNIAIFDEVLINEGTPEEELTIGAATLRFGLVEFPLFEVNVQGFLAIRETGIAASLILGLDAGIGDFFKLQGDAVFVVNTTGEEVIFDVPGGASVPNGPTGLSLTIPQALPPDPPTFFEDVTLEGLIDGTVWDATGIPGIPYGIVFLRGSVGLNIPGVTELSFAGETSFHFVYPPSPNPEDPELVLDFLFGAFNLVDIGVISGAFHVSFDFDPFFFGFELPNIDVWGAAIVDTDPSFLERGRPVCQRGWSVAVQLHGRA